MKIAFHKLSDTQHVLVIERLGRSERVQCETRSYLAHDLLHYAVESEAQIEHGFWGSLARGKTLAEMNERSSGAMAPELATIEATVGALSTAVKGRSARDMIESLQRYAETQGSALPPYLTERFIEAVQERMRKLLGHWRATPFGGAMELSWPG